VANNCKRDGIPSDVSSALMILKVLLLTRFMGIIMKY
jgi:hypothetical protein